MIRRSRFPSRRQRRISRNLVPLSVLDGRFYDYPLNALNVLRNLPPLTLLRAFAFYAPRAQAVEPRAAKRRGFAAKNWHRLWESARAGAPGSRRVERASPRAPRCTRSRRLLTWSLPNRAMSLNSPDSQCHARFSAMKRTCLQLSSTQFSI